MMRVGNPIESVEKGISMRHLTAFRANLCIIAALVCSAACMAVDRSHNSRVEVRTQDFLDTVTVIGELGCPIGTEVEVVGYCETDRGDIGWPDKLHLFQLNGRPLKAEVVIPVQSITPAWLHHEPVNIQDGDIIRLRGFESGYFTGLPLPKGFNPKIPTAIPANCAFCYETTFRYLSTEKLKDKESRDTVKKVIAENRKTSRMMSRTAREQRSPDHPNKRPEPPGNGGPVKK